MLLSEIPKECARFDSEGKTVIITAALVPACMNVSFYARFVVNDTDSLCVKQRFTIGLLRDESNLFGILRSMPNYTYRIYGRYKTALRETDAFAKAIENVVVPFYEKIGLEGFRKLFVDNYGV